MNNFTFKLGEQFFDKRYTVHSYLLSISTSNLIYVNVSARVWFSGRKLCILNKVCIFYLAKAWTCLNMSFPFDHIVYWKKCKLKIDFSNSLAIPPQCIFTKLKKTFKMQMVIPGHEAFVKTDLRAFSFKAWPMDGFICVLWGEKIPFAMNNFKLWNLSMKLQQCKN